MPAGHFIPEEQPQKTAEALQAFFVCPLSFSIFECCDSLNSN